MNDRTQQNHFQDPRNDPLLGMEDLEPRTVAVLGFDQNLSAQEILERMEERGTVTGLSVIRARMKEANIGRIRWVGKTITYAEYQDSEQLVIAGPNVDSVVIFLHGERVLNRMVEVYRSNKMRIGLPYDNLSPGWTNKLIEEVDGSESLRSWWVHPRRKDLLWTGKDQAVVGGRARVRREFEQFRIGI